MKWAAAFAFAVILTLHAIAVVHALPRSLDHDEGEHLRAAEWIASGKTIYRDFVENHTPFLYLMLAPLAPASSDVADLESYVRRARLLSALAGTLAALCVAFVAVRASGQAAAAAPVLAVLLLPGWMLSRGVLDVRAEPYTLLLFWSGVLLMTSRRWVIVKGMGAGLLCAAALWNPKWPIETAVVLGWYLATVFRQQWRAAVLSLGAAALAPLLMLAAALHATTLRELIFFAYRYPAAFYEWFRTSPVVQATVQFEGPFEYCAEPFQPWIAVLAIVIFAIAYFTDPRRRRLAVLPAALVVAGAIEIRFLYSYPRLWPQYFVMWSCSLAALYGVTLAMLARRRPVWLAIGAVVAALGFAAIEFVEIEKPVDERHWGVKASLLARVHPGDGVWLWPEDCPFPAPAGSYYWYAYHDQVPFSLTYARTPEARPWLPQITEDDLPPCRQLRGLRPGDVFVRLMDERNVRNLPQAKRCLQALIDANLARRVHETVWEVSERARIPTDSSSSHRRSDESAGRAAAP
jgi:hypothetical protein